MVQELSISSSRTVSSTVKSGTLSMSPRTSSIIYSLCGLQLLTGVFKKFSTVSQRIFLSFLIDTGQFRNTKNITDNYIYRTLTITIFQYFNNAIMFLFAFHNFFSEPDSTKLFRGQFLDFNMRWYQVIGVPIITAIFFQIFTPHFGLIVNQIKMSILRCWDRRCTLNKRKTRQIT